MGPEHPRIKAPPSRRALTPPPKITPPSEFFRSLLKLGDANLVEVGEQVYVAGNPMGLEGTFSQGIISGVRHVGGDVLIQITAPISPGSSGGPVINANGEAIGEGSLRDFHKLTAVVSQLRGGVYLNIGSAVILPEVFLKALTLARNLGYDVQDFTTVNMDFMQHYRPTTNVVKRPTQQSGRGYTLIGHHEIMVPLLVAALLEELRRTGS